MEPEHSTNIHAAALGQRGGYVRAERLSAQELAYLIQQTLKNGRQLPLV